MNNRIRGVIGLGAALGLFLSGCSRSPAVELPADPAERAALCYSATLAQFAKDSGTTALTPDQLNRGTHFLLLEVSRSGIAEPDRVAALAAQGATLAGKLESEGSAARYAEPCAEAFPETRAEAFKALPADSLDTRISCFMLSSALLQMYAASDMVPDERAGLYTMFNTRMNQRLTQEMQARAEPSEAEFNELTMRGLAQAVRLGPPTRVMDACIARYSAS